MRQIKLGKADFKTICLTLAKQDIIANQPAHVLYEITNTQSKDNEIFKQSTLELCKIWKAQEDEFERSHTLQM